MSIFYQHGLIIRDWLVDIYGDAAHSRGSFRKDKPFTLLIGEVDKVSFVVYLEVQFKFSPVRVPKMASS